MGKVVAGSRRFGGVFGSFGRPVAAAALGATLLAGQPAAASGTICGDRDALSSMMAATRVVEGASPDDRAGDLVRILNEAGSKLVRSEDDPLIDPVLLSLRRQFVINYRTLRATLAWEGTQGAQAYLADREVQAVSSVLEAVLNATDCHSDATKYDVPDEGGAAAVDRALSDRPPKLKLGDGFGSAAGDAGPGFDPMVLGALGALSILAAVAVVLLMRKDMRQDVRIATDVKVGITFAGAHHTGRMRDISLSGAKIACSTLQPALGDELGLVIAKRNFAATVIWQANGFTGVRFKQRISDSLLPHLLDSLGI